MKPGCASGFAESHGPYATVLPWATGFAGRLFSEQCTDLIDRLSKLPPSDQAAVGALFGQVTSLADELGQQVAGATDRGASLIEDQKRTNRLLEALLTEAKKSPDRFDGLTPAQRQRLLLSFRNGIGAKPNPSRWQRFVAWLRR